MLIRIVLDDDYKVTDCGYGSNDYYSHTVATLIVSSRDIL